MRENTKKSNRRGDKKIYITLLLLICISVGFAYLSATLNLIGNTTISGQTWDVHFNNIQESAATYKNSRNETVNVADNGAIDYVKVGEAGSQTDNTVDVLNAGTIDAMLTDISNTVPDTNTFAKYLTYTVVYDDATGGAPTKNTSAPEGIRSSEKATLKVRVEFKKDIENADLPGTDQYFESTLTLTYSQADQTANYAHSKSNS